MDNLCWPDNVAVKLALAAHAFWEDAADLNSLKSLRIPYNSESSTDYRGSLIQIIVCAVPHESIALRLHICSGTAEFRV